MTTDDLVLGIGTAGWVLGICTFAHDYPAMRREHRQRQRSRLEYGGWTLPWWMCGLWWFGWERRAPGCFRSSAVRQDERRS